MKREQVDQRGSSHIFLLLLLFVFAAICYSGYLVYVKQGTKPVLNNAATAAKVIPIPAKIETKAEAEQASKALDAEAIDTRLDSSQFDNMIKSVLQ